MLNSPALRFTNGSAQAVTVAAASSINNLGSCTVAMWVDLSTVAPAAQRNFFGKASGNNRFVAFINGTTISVQAGSSVSAPTATALTSNCAGVVANQPIFLLFVIDAGIGSPALYTGSLCVPASEPSAYSTQTTGSTTGHDDSASAWNFGNGPAVGTTNTLPGNIISVQVYNRIPHNVAEVREMQYDPWNTTRSGCVLSWRVGAAGDVAVLDESGRGNHGLTTGSPVSVVDPLQLAPRESVRLAVWKRALFAPSGTGTLTSTLSAATLSATGALPITGTATATLAAATVAGTGTLAIAGAVTATLGTATLAGTGALALSGSLTATLANATVAGVGTLPIVGTATATLADATLSGTGTIGSFATLSVTLGAATLSATGTLPIVGAASLTTAAATLSSTGTLPVVGALTATLGSATVAGLGALSIAGSATLTLADATLSAIGSSTGDGSPTLPANIIVATVAVHNIARTMVVTRTVRSVAFDG